MVIITFLIITFLIITFLIITFRLKIKTVTYVNLDPGKCEMLGDFPGD